MMPRWSLLAVPLVAATALFAHARAAVGFDRNSKVLVAELGRRSRNKAVASFQVPAIIESYARRAVPSGSVPQMVRLRQRGEMRLRPGGRWCPFTAEQTMSVCEPGFVWLANMQLAPLVYARVIDAYVAGRGLLEARLYGSVPLARAVGPPIDRGELMRYLAELVWIPHAMLHNSQLRWHEIGNDIVEVSVGSPDAPARVRLAFANGDIACVEADDRPYSEGGNVVPRRWVGRF